MKTNIAHIEYFCSLLYSSIRIPISWYDADGRNKAGWPSTELAPISVPIANSDYEIPDLHVSDSHGLYGILPLSNKLGTIFLGPAYSTPVNLDMIHAFIKENAISNEKRELVTNMLYAIPITPYLSFLHHMELLSYGLLGKQIDLTHRSLSAIDGTPKNLNEELIEKNTMHKENQTYHNSFLWEQELYHLIQAGNTDALRTFYRTSQLLANEGQMAPNPLRNAKNLFIGTVTKVGMLAAIPGGLDVEQTYELIDTYTQECERLTTIAEINQLHGQMALDFCARMSEIQIPEGLSREVYLCMCYIRDHTNEAISIADVADHIHRSSSYIIVKFQQELGINIGAYIRRCKLEEAKSLLTYSNKPLAEISSYLCFSSQSYFQNVFKKKYGVTPMQYRKQHHLFYSSYLKSPASNP